ncbi:hypothetical protein [Streptomyces sp. TP-A0356]|uniref:hypothetical protein n=1 Tax=Streptomyces sp. TP-A0356 TaxID=1359208 RepID=UPI0006E3B479
MARYLADFEPESEAGERLVTALLLRDLLMHTDRRLVDDVALVAIRRARPPGLGHLLGRP